MFKLLVARVGKWPAAISDQMSALALVAALAICQPAFAEPIHGAGSTFAAPIINQWSRNYQAARTEGGDYISPDWRVDYEPVGSLAGIMRLSQPEMDFAVSEEPLSPSELTKRNLAQFPIVMGGIAVVANINEVGAGELRLSGKVIADIYLGTITKWSDPAIKALNHDIALPDATIEVLHRLDGSGTTFAFTNYLSKVSPEWQERPGAGTLIEWPLGQAGRGNSGVVALAAATKNSIAYLEYGQVIRAGLPFVTLENASGTFVRPDPFTFQAGLSSIPWDAATGFYADTANPAGANAYPIPVTTYAIVPKDRAQIRINRVRDLFRLAFEKGGDDASSLGYVPISPRLAKEIDAYWTKNLHSRNR